MDEETRSVGSAASDEGAVEGDVEDEIGAPARNTRPFSAQGEKEEAFEDARIHHRTRRDGAAVVATKTAMAATTARQDAQLAVLFVGVLLALHASGRIASWFWDGVVRGVGSVVA